MADETSSSVETAPSQNESEADSVEHDVPILTPADMDRNVLVGICGVQAAGKTVFLSSIFHTMNGETIAGIGSVSFDREDKGGALYFERIENEIRQKGIITPTREPAIARLLVAPPSTSSSTAEETGIILFDFAGRYFTEFADLPAALETAETPQERRELELVKDYLERCDAFIVLVDSQNFGRDQIAGRVSPFPASVIFLRTYCSRNHKPLALVFTKKDLNPGLSSADVRNFEAVRKFQRIFSEDDSAAGRPFGLVEHLSCYEVDSTGDVLEQSSDGSIWCLGPSQVFVRILRAAWSKAMLRLAEACDRERKEQALQRGAHLMRFLKAAALVVTLLLVAASPLFYRAVSDYLNRREAISAAELVATHLGEDRPGQIAREGLEKLRWLAHQNQREAAAPVWTKLERELRELFDDVADTYPLGGGEPAGTHALLVLGDILGITGHPALEMLRERQRFLEAVEAEGLPPEDKLTLVTRTLTSVDELGDHAFHAALEASAADLRETVALKLAEPGYEESTLADRVQFVRLRLRSSEPEKDPLMDVVARRAYGRFLGASLAELRERDRLAGLITTAIPDLSALVSVPELGSRQVLEYRVVREELFEPRELSELTTLHARVAPLLQEIMTGRGESVERLLASTLDDLFRGLDSEDRSSVWSDFFDGAESEYFFVLRSDAWPGNFRPWIAELRSRLEDEKFSKSTSDRTIQEISQRPLYWSEISDIADVAASQYLDHATVRSYREVIDEIENGSTNFYTVRQRLNEIATLAETMQNAHTGLFGEPRRLLDDRREVASSFAAQASLARYDVFAKNTLLRDLTRSLRTICRTRLRSSEGDCAS